ncbi:hypothetical protein PUN4_280189 [Paraburkholderia unamae]|nr:hypothetical protein PUN4_280189 [Paraburkholderia unamae]
MPGAASTAFPASPHRSQPARAHDVAPVSNAQVRIPPVAGISGETLIQMLVTLHVTLLKITLLALFVDQDKRYR